MKKKKKRVKESEHIFTILFWKSMSLMFVSYETQDMLGFFPNVHGLLL